MTIGKSVTSMGRGVFNDCTALTDVYYPGSEKDRANIEIENQNSALSEATWHYNYKPASDPTTTQTTTEPETETSSNQTDVLPLVLVIAGIVMVGIVAAWIVIAKKKKQA